MGFPMNFLWRCPLGTPTSSSPGLSPFDEDALIAGLHLPLHPLIPGFTDIPWYRPRPTCPKRLEILDGGYRSLVPVV